MIPEQDNVALCEHKTHPKDISAHSPDTIKNKGDETASHGRSAYQHQHQQRSLSMGAAARMGRVPAKTDQGRIMDPESDLRIAYGATELSLSPETSPISKNTTAAGTLIPGKDSDCGDNSLLPSTTDLAHQDGSGHITHRSHDSIITDTNPGTKSGSSSDLLGPRIKQLDEERRPWFTQDSPQLSQVLPSRKVEDSTQPPAAMPPPHTNRPSVTFAPSRSPEPSSPRRSMKASILATVFATTANKAVVAKTTVAAPTKESITDSVRVSGPPLRKRPSKLSSLSSTSSTSSTSMVFANPDYVVPSKTMQLHKISSPEPSPAFDHSMNADAFVSPRPAPAPPASVPSRALSSSKPTGLPEPIVVEVRSQSEQSATLVGASPSGSHNDSRQGNLMDDTYKKQSQHGAHGGTSNPSRLSVPSDMVVPGEWAIPSATQISRAALLPVKGEDGQSVQFGTLFTAHRTIVVFIRHFWCPLCQDYMASLRALVKPEMLARPKNTTQPKDYPQQRSKGEKPAALRRSIDGRAESGPGQTEEQQLVGFVVIGNGAHAMIRKYRQIFGLPFAVYTDPDLDVYRALGMGRDGDDGHRHLPTSPTIAQPYRRGSLSNISNTPSTARLSQVEKQVKKDSGYVKHGLVGGIAMVVVRALKVGMPVWEKGGDIGQLGGEFIFGPGYVEAIFNPQE